MSITSGYTKYKRYAKLSDGTYKLVSQWTNANTVHFDDGSTAQTNLGAIKGITSDLAGESQNVAASIYAANQLNSKINELNSSMIVLINKLGNITFTAIPIGNMPNDTTTAEITPLPEGYTFNNTFIVGIRILRGTSYIYSGVGDGMCSVYLDCTNNIQLVATTQGIQYCKDEHVSVILAKIG